MTLADAFDHPVFRLVSSKSHAVDLTCCSLLSQTHEMRGEKEFAAFLKVQFTPTVLFFDTRGKEVFRIETYLKPFHFASSFDCVAGGAYRTQPGFRRFIQGRAENIRARGGKIDLW